MQGIILMALMGSAVGALVPLGPGFYSSLITQRQAEFPVQHLDAPTLGVYPPRQYLVYNYPQVNPPPVRTIPTAVFENGRPAIAHIPMTYNYYGTPVYDFRFPFEPMSPPAVGIPSAPGFGPGPAIPQPPTEPSDDDGIEKLDEKVEPADHDPVGEPGDGFTGGEVADENDSVAIEAAA